MSGRIAAFAMHLKARGIELQTTVFSPPSSPDESKMMLGNPAYRSAVDYVLTRWLTLKDQGSKATIARKREYIEIGSNSKDPIDGWLPNRAGVLPYLRGTTQTVLKMYYAKQKELDRIAGPSLDALQEASNLELTNDRTFVPRIRVDASDMDEAAFELDLSQGRAALGADGSGADDEHAPEGDKEEPDTVGVASAEDQLLDEYRLSTPLGREDIEPTLSEEERRKHDLDEQISTAERENDDWPLQVFAPDLPPEAGVDTIREAVRNILERAKPFDSDVQADWETLTMYLNQWDGAAPLNVVLPEFAEVAKRNRYVLSGIGQQLPLAGFTPPGELALPLEIMRTTPVPEEPGSSTLHMHVAAENISIYSMLSAEYDPMQLNQPDRIDYLFLCEHTRERPADFTGPDLHAEMKRLAKLWLAPLVDARNSSRTAKEACQFSNSILHEWNPAKEFLADRINAITFDMAQEKDGQPEKAAKSRKKADEKQMSVPGI